MDIKIIFSEVTGSDYIESRIIASIFAYYYLSSCNVLFAHTFFKCRILILVPFFFCMLVIYVVVYNQMTVLSLQIDHNTQVLYSKILLFATLLFSLICCDYYFFYSPKFSFAAF